MDNLPILLSMYKVLDVFTEHADDGEEGGIQGRILSVLVLTVMNLRIGSQSSVASASTHHGGLSSTIIQQGGS
ncbi:hypothetical protein SOVF_161310 [Spinacia oleracea]|nr:hypothetical protein SOVF_161310 [Spinacia oleracea]